MPDIIDLPRGILVAIEGIDGAGKTTQADLLRERLTLAGLSVLVTKEPTNGPWGRMLRESARIGRLPLDQELEAFVEDRRQHVAEVITPALASGQVVIVDRYYLSTAAYQGARGADPITLLEQNEAFAPWPDIAFVLDVPPVMGIARIRARGDIQNEFEKAENLRIVAGHFGDINRIREYVRKVDGNPAIEVVTEVLLRIIDRELLFQALCPREHLNCCQPEYCAERYHGTCQYLRLSGLHPHLELPPDELDRIAESETMTDREKLDAMKALLAGE